MRAVTYRLPDEQYIDSFDAYPCYPIIEDNTGVRFGKITFLAKPKIRHVLFGSNRPSQSMLNRNPFLAIVEQGIMVKDKTMLPFEVTYSERPGKKSKSMKRLAVLLKPENVDGIIAALKNSGLEATIYDVKGVGKDKERVSSGRVGTMELAYTTRKIVATVVNPDDVEDVVARMKKALGGESGAVVVISSVDDLVRL